MTNSLKRGEELNQLSRLLFDSAANKWYGALGIETVAGVLAVMFNFISLSGDTRLWAAASVAILSLIAYLLRQWFEWQYDLAETMRRQSALTEGLGLAITNTLYSEWRRRSGKRILARLNFKPRDAGYYATTRRIGPKKLLEMTLESAFWTRALYIRLRRIATLLSIFGIALIIGFFVSLSFQSIPDTLAESIAYAAFLLVPVLLSINMIGWALKLSRLITSIAQIEGDMEQLHKTSRVDEASALRLIFEYNCQLVAGFPIHNLVFKLSHDAIQKEWDACN
jgi:hypothetical protein